eukprot:CAMPEP_0179220260 /NCGR_PEP_ID=MMETSP0797-20121207/5509_1 /TAXON_ID=47934 /ORGANISM="Dinophysis acuminata, Strain DAEP01" /LENGTH=75 /DNA_ID=CAMNT_0020926857 /DNA_START=169 /DNA_END=396 /DNA_ORIENTATION=+
MSTRGTTLIWLATVLVPTQIYLVVNSCCGQETEYSAQKRRPPAIFNSPTFMCVPHLGQTKYALEDAHRFVSRVGV